MSVWLLDDGLKLVRALQDDSRKFGYHLALGGGVLNRGESKKDIDLYFLPLMNHKLFPKANPGELLEWLEKMWGAPLSIGQEYGEAETVSFDIETPAAGPAIAAPPTAPPIPTPGIPIAQSPFIYRPAVLTTSRRIANSLWANDSALERFIFSEPAPSVPSVPELGWNDLSPAPIEPRATGPYVYKLKYNRRGDRIDVFILRS